MIFEYVDSELNLWFAEKSDSVLPNEAQNQQIELPRYNPQQNNQVPQQNQPNQVPQNQPQVTYQVPQNQQAAATCVCYYYIFCILP